MRLSDKGGTSDGQETSQQGKETSVSGRMGAGKGGTPLGTTRTANGCWARTRAEVKGKLAVTVAQSQQLDVSRSGEYTVAKWLRLWFDLYTKPIIRPSTAGYYRRVMEEYIIPTDRPRQAEQAHQPGDSEALQGSAREWVAPEKAEEETPRSQWLHRAGASTSCSTTPWTGR